MNRYATPNTERLAWLVGVHVVFDFARVRIGSASIASDLNVKVERVEPSGAPLFWLFRSTGAAAPGSSLDNASLAPWATPDLPMSLAGACSRPSVTATFRRN